jgi:hypothetical protein
MTAKKTTFSIFRLPNSCWAIQREQEPISGYYATKTHAISIAKAFAEAEQPSELRIQNASGDWELQSVDDAST